MTMTRLPGSVADLRGLRAARWIRESSGRQFDKNGPDAQRRVQDDAIEAFGLVDTGLTWTLAASGWSGPDSMDDPPALRSPQFQAMLAAAETGEYDVLLVGYTSRFIRDLSTALTIRRRLHRSGVVIWIQDDQILTSAAADWERFVDKSKAAEVYSADLSKNIRSGYRAKLATDRDPGGRPPYGFRRNPETKFLEPDEDQATVARTSFELAAAGGTDRAIGTQLDLPLFTVRGILTSPLYAGRLRDGRPTRFAPIVTPALWDQAQTVRARRATSTGRPPSPRRPYALARLHCAHCGARLTGDTGYYRHREPCQRFLEAKPRLRRRRGRLDGKAYQREWYEAVVGELLRRVSIGSDLLADVVGQVVERPAEPDAFALARIERDRDQAIARYRRGRDSAALEATMTRLDADEAAAREPVVQAGIAAADAVEVLRDVAAAWDELVDRPGEARRQLADAIFERIEVSGFRSATVTLTAHARAHGFDQVIPRELTFAPGDLLGLVGARGLSPILSNFRVRIAGSPDLVVVRASRSA